MRLYNDTYLKPKENSMWHFVDHLFDKDGWTAYIFGSLAGMIHFLSVYLLDTTYAGALIRAGGTALVVGFMSVAGKYLFSYLKDKWLKRRKPGKD